MPTSKSEFVDLIRELRIEFPDAVRSCAFTKPATGGTYDPVEGAQTGGTAAQTDTIQCLEDSFKLTQFDGSQIQTGDFIIIAIADEFSSVTPRTDGVSVSVDGVDSQIVSATTDSLKASWAMQVRRL